MQCCQVRQDFGSQKTKIGRLAQWLWHYAAKHKVTGLILCRIPMGVECGNVLAQLILHFILSRQCCWSDASSALQYSMIQCTQFWSPMQDSVLRKLCNKCSRTNMSLRSFSYLWCLLRGTCFTHCDCNTWHQRLRLVTASYVAHSYFLLSHGAHNFLPTNASVKSRSSLRGILPYVKRSVGLH